MNKRQMVIIVLAILLQGGVVGLALLIGIMEAEPRVAEGALALGGSPIEQRSRDRAASKQISQLQRATESIGRELAREYLESAHAVPQGAALDVGATFGTMGTMMADMAGFKGMESGMAAGDAMPPDADPVTFMGENLNATRIVLVLDVSASLKSKLERAGWSLERVRGEVLAFLDQLGPNHLFGIIQFTRNWLPFRDDLVPATVGVKEAARAWMAQSFQTTGTSGRNWRTGQPNGIEAILAAAFAMDPQLNEVFILSDGDFYRTPAGGGGQRVPLTELRALTRRLQERQIGTTRLRMLAFYPPDDARLQLGEWVRENANGSLRVVEDPASR